MQDYIRGNPVSPGIVMGKAFVYRKPSYEVEEGYILDGQQEEEYQKYLHTLHVAEEELENLVHKIQQTDPDKAKIFTAHKEILMDEELVDSIRAAIISEHRNAEYAVWSTFKLFKDLLGKVKEERIASRIVDLDDVRNRLLRIFQGKVEKNLSQLEENIILVAHDLLPSDTASIDRQHVLAIVTEVGGATSHSAILARSYAIPAILGAPQVMSKITNGMLIAVDCTRGEMVLNPSKGIQQEYVRRIEQFHNKLKQQEVYRNRPALTRDHEQIELGINIGNKAGNGTTIDEPYYDFIGLYRTEFLFMQGVHLPTEEEQFQEYVQTLNYAKGKVVTLRTLDIGGDKTLPYMELPKEDNPFLGNRALRLCVSRPELFRTQLRAILRASAYGNLQVMFPMVGSMEDIRLAKKVVADVKAELDTEQIAYDPNMKLGVMIEIPTVAVIADLVAKEVDFASVGTNDLTQYMCAADRMNPDVSQYYQDISPAMLRILYMIFTAFHKEDKPVSVCGEMAGNPLSAALLIGLGARKLSMSEANLSKIKAAVANIAIDEATSISQYCCNLNTKDEIINYCKMKFTIN